VTLTVTDLREHVETPLGDDALERLLDAAYESIEEVAGPAASVREVLTPGPGDLLMLSRSAESVTTLIEIDTELETDDFELIGRQMVRRLNTGTNPASCWRGRVDVTYAPGSDDASRDRVAIELVKLDLDNAPGIASETLGDHSKTYAQGKSYAETRADLLASLAGPGIPFL